MLSSEEGKLILHDKPRINSKTIDLKALKELPPGTLGHAYIKFLSDNVSTHLSFEFCAEFLFTTTVFYYGIIIIIIFFS